MEIKIPEIEARTILLTYEGSNNQLLDWKRKIDEVKNFKLTRPQAEYVMKYYELSSLMTLNVNQVILCFLLKSIESR